ncbi:protein NO VEIN domain-containing protein [Methylomagnum ishizawai]|uniref:protein NO VEIN domain-containing protein n=1 Tax=Methylomagnum ishizawai TaxID=1760988 RepID=UPI001C817ADD|nr:DUF3883 domain-containing protein [Methylomagnum ishizawai]
MTLFEYHYRNTSGAKQKAINMDAAVFVNVLFPTLPGRIDAIRDRVKITLEVYGPGEAGIHSITRKILKQQKNWRLNGELIVNPPEEPGRYDPLQKGDYAILDFVGDPEPHTARMYLVARALPQDAALHAALDAKYGAAFSPRKGMEPIDLEDLAQLLGGLSLPEGHPVLDFIDSDTLEDAAQGGVEALRKLRKRRKARGVSREEFGRAKRAAEQVGRLGEEILNGWLETEQHAGRIQGYRWESDANAIAPYDFVLVEDGADIRRIDAKSTTGDFKNPIHVSLAELFEMAEGGLPYDLYRLYSVSENSARLRIAKGLRETAARILEPFRRLPSGVTVDGVSIAPETLGFGEEIIISFSANDEGIDE